MRNINKSFGQSLLEFALVLPLLLVLVMGLFDLGRAIFYYSVLNNAAREGARTATVQKDCLYKAVPGSDVCGENYLDTSYPVINCNNPQSQASTIICEKIENTLFNISELSSSQIIIDVKPDGNEFEVQVNISFEFKPVTPGLGLMGNLTLNANSRMLKSPVAF
jgi:hypothetical protein